MMPAIVLPNIGVSYGWTAGEDGWKPGMDTNLVMLDCLLHLSVISTANTPPGSPANGDRYIVGASPTGAWSGQAGRIAVWVNAESVWRFFVPKLGWRAWSAAAANYVRFNGSVWVDDGSLPLVGGGTVAARVIVNDAGVKPINDAAGALGAFEVRSPDNAGAAAFMAFHRINRFAAYLGIDTDDKLKVGGWSMGANAYEIYHQGNPPPSQSVLLVRDQKASGTAGGTFTSGAWRTRDLNTVLTNEIAGASLASNQIVLPAGTYDVRAFAVADRPRASQLRLRNVTDGTDLAIGVGQHDTVPYGDSGDAAAAHLDGRFVLAGTRTIELQHRCSVTRTTTGFGRPVSFDTPEVYALVRIVKV
jgi:hypothetical protein